MRTRWMVCLMPAGCMLGAPALAQTGSGVVLEGGAVWQSRNVARIPNSAAGSKFSLRDLQGSGAEAAWRVDATWQVAERHQLRAMYAPYSITRTGIPDSALQFDGATFAAGEPTPVHYRFDSWRLSYRYRFHHGADWTWWGGATLKVRDASIGLSQVGVEAAYDNTGLVPLLSLAGYRRLGDRWTLVLDADGLLAPQGRAFDIALKARYALGERLSLGLGVRTLEGGADNDDVYTFAWQHYALVEVGWRF
jgi:hypothetical protein